MWPATLLLTFSATVGCHALRQKPRDSVLVRTSDGFLRGEVVTSVWGHQYHSFRGIPFAEPPVGDLRFKSPRPAKSWSGVKDVTSDVAYCYQKPSDRTTLPLSEDCLYMDVYVSTAPKMFPSMPLPVLVWIHGGAFIRGTGVHDVWGPDVFMNHPTILVSSNYRKGVLGFLNVEHPEVTSNAGLKDQVLALRWVQRNIAQFGGDPNDVTIFGNSAGGWIVEVMMMSPMAKGLFHRAICQSGSVFMDRADYNHTRAAFRLAEVLGYNATDRDDLVRFLRQTSPEDLVKGQELARYEADGSTVALSLYPVIDARVQEGGEVFLPETPERLFKTGRINRVPYILGVTSQETKHREKYYTAEVYEDMNCNFEQFIPTYLNVTRKSATSLVLAEKIRTFYFGEKNVSYDTLQELTDLTSDTWMVHPVHRSASFFLADTTVPLRVYLFTYDGTLRLNIGNYTLKGPAHADDSGYLFYLHWINYCPNDEDVAVIDHFTRMWYDFGWSGNPTVRENVDWTPARKDHRAYLQLDTKLSMHKDMYKERMAFWDQVYHEHGYGYN